MINFIKTFFHHFIDRATLIKSNTSKDKKKVRTERSGILNVDIILDSTGLLGPDPTV